MEEDIRIVPKPDTVDRYDWIAEPNIRLLVRKMNELGIPKENVVSAIFIIAISVIVFVGLFIKHFLCYKRKQTFLK